MLLFFQSQSASPESQQEENCVWWLHKIVGIGVKCWRHTVVQKTVPIPILKRSWCSTSGWLSWTYVRSQNLKWPINNTHFAESLMKKLESFVKNTLHQIANPSSNTIHWPLGIRWVSNLSFMLFMPDFFLPFTSLSLHLSSKSISRPFVFFDLIFSFSSQISPLSSSPSSFHHPLTS